MDKYVKPLYSIVLFMLFTQSAFVQAEQLATSYLLQTKIPTHIHSTAGLKAYYKGYQVDLSEGWALLPECDSPLTFSILVTENVATHGKKNTVRYLQRIEELDAKWYDLTLSLHVDPETNATIHQWHIDQPSQDDIPVRIPDNTIIVLTNPDFVGKVESEPTSTDNTNINLPTIVFKQSIDKDEFQEALIGTIMATLNLDAIHKKNRPLCEKRHKAAIISSATKQ